MGWLGVYFHCYHAHPVDVRPTHPFPHPLIRLWRGKWWAGRASSFRCYFNLPVVVGCKVGLILFRASFLFHFPGEILTSLVILEYSSDFDLRVLSLFFCGDSHGGQHEEVVALHGLYIYSFTI